MDKMIWIKKHKLELLIILGILLLAAFFRFYKISEYMTFLGDEGRDALAVKRILVDNDFPLLGPPTSVGNMYLGPLYYYMMAMPMAIFWLNPVAASSMNALIGVLAVSLIYYLARNWFDVWGATVASFLYAISPITIIYSKSSWNPNPAPLFALLIFLGLFKVHKKRNGLWFILVGVAMAFILQMHYLALILLPVVGILSLYEVILHFRVKDKSKFLFEGIVFGLLLFLVLMSPLAVFDFKYNFVNYRAFTNIVVGENSSVGLSLFALPQDVLLVLKDKLIGRYLTVENNYLRLFLSFLIILPLGVAGYLKLKGKKLFWPHLALGVWMGFSLIGLSFYNKSIFDHYLGFLSPTPYLLLAGFVGLSSKKFKIIISLALIIVLGFFNLQKNPLFDGPNRQLQKTQEIAKKVIADSGNKPYNFALIAQSNYDSAYQFYLYIYGHQPKVLPIEKTDQLFVVCEDLICKPVGHPKHEVAAFGWTQIEKEETLAGVKLFKLVPYTQDK